MVSYHSNTAYLEMLSSNLYYPHLWPIHFYITNNTNKLAYLICKPTEDQKEIKREWLKLVCYADSGMLDFKKPPNEEARTRKGDIKTQEKNGLIGIFI